MILNVRLNCVRVRLVPSRARLTHIFGVVVGSASSWDECLAVFFTFVALNMLNAEPERQRDNWKVARINRKDENVKLRDFKMKYWHRWKLNYLVKEKAML